MSSQLRWSRIGWFARRATIVDVVGAAWIVPVHCSLEECGAGDTHRVLKERYPQGILFRTRMGPQVLA